MKKTNQFRCNRISILFSLTTLLLISFNGIAQLKMTSGGNVGIGTTTPGANLNIAQTITASGTLKGFIYTGALNTNQTLSTEIPSATFTTTGRQWATGAIATQREFLITAPTYSFVGASTITDAATVGIAGAPIKSTYASITNTHAFLVQSTNVGAATNSYGLTVNAQIGAANNYAAQFMGGNVGIGTSTPAAKLNLWDGAQYFDVTGLAHGMTSLVPTTTFGRIVNNNSSGGLNIAGFSSGINRALCLVGIIGGGYSSVPSIVLSGSKKNGTTVQALAEDELLLQVANNSTSPVMSILGNGNVGIGTIYPGYKLDVQNGGTSTVNINTNGTVQASAGVLTSDQMFKTNVDSLQSALTTIRQLKPKSYYFDTINFNGEGKFNFQSVKQYGFIANDIENLLPELVTHSIKPAIVDSLGNVTNPAYAYRALNYNAFIPILTKGIQELQFKNDSLQSKVNNQDSIIASLQNQVLTNNVLLQNQLDQLLTIITTCCSKSEIRSTQPATNESQSSINQTRVELNNAQTIVLEQNSPNPFSERTSINYYLPDNTGKAQILFYNASGKLIQSVDLIQKGKGSLNVFASDLSNGMYTYTLVVDGKIIETKKMVKQ